MRAVTLSEARPMVASVLAALNGRPFDLRFFAYPSTDAKRLSWSSSNNPMTSTCSSSWSSSTSLFPISATSTQLGSSSRRRRASMGGIPMAEVQAGPIVAISHDDAGNPIFIDNTGAEMDGDRRPVGLAPARRAAGQKRGYRPSGLSSNSAPAGRRRGNSASSISEAEPLSTADSSQRQPGRASQLKM